MYCGHIRRDDAAVLPNSYLLIGHGKEGMHHSSDDAVVLPLSWERKRKLALRAVLSSPGW